MAKMRDAKVLDKRLLVDSFKKVVNKKFNLPKMMYRTGLTLIAQKAS